MPSSVKTGGCKHKELRVCRVCTQNQVEDEMHFLLQCPSYCERRETLFNQIEKFCDVKTLDSPVKYAEIMSSKDETVMKALGAYIVDCLKLRMQMLREPGGNSGDVLWGSNLENRDGSEAVTGVPGHACAPPS